MICFVFKPKRVVDGIRQERKNYSGKLKLDTWAKPKVFSLQTGDRRIAEMKLQELAKDFEKEALGLLPARTVRAALNEPLSELLKNFMVDLRAKGRSAGTLRKYHGTLKILFARLNWSELRAVNAKAFVTWRAQSGLSGKSVNDLLANAQGFFRWLCNQRQLVEDPLSHVQRVDTRGKMPCRRALSPEQFAELLRVSPLHRAVVYALALYTGLRRKELNQIRWVDFLLDDGNPRVRVPASIAKNRRDATLPLHADLAATLRRMRPPGYDSLSRPFLHKVPRIETVRRDLERAGIPLRDEVGRRVDFHSLRMTFGTTLLANGVHPIVVKELMRHSDLKLTTNLYNDPSQLPLAQGVAALPKMTGEFDLTGRVRMHTTKRTHDELSAQRDVRSNSPALQNTASKRTQIRAQTGVAMGGEVSSPDASGQSVNSSQLPANGAVRQPETLQNARVRMS
ncbi:tyrosine-type recombinase/integrase [Oleiharenicola lentus]|uniref:tyrosine-type recombinase/integrase n=1 Tax=Oleiharenicola lentus TaxID=2508720 RepID=UPI003F66AD63